MAKRKNKNKELMVIIVIAIIAIIGIVGVSMIDQVKYNIAEKTGSYAKIKFNEMYEIQKGMKTVSQTFQSFDGQMVELSGYMAVQSPLDESYIYLVSQPYVSCPFCAIGDVTKLEVIPVYMANGTTIKYNENGVTVRGTLEVSEKVDTLGYTTQSRIYADKITELSDSDVDQDLQKYYALLSQNGMIIDIQTLQMNIEYATNPTYMNEMGTTKASVADAIVEEYYDIPNYNYFFDEDGNPEEQGIDAYVRYIKECPDIVAACEPERDDLIVLNRELIEIYHKQITVMEKFADIIKEGKEASSDSAKEEVYEKLVALNSENLAMYEEFTKWDNQLRS